MCSRWGHCSLKPEHFQATCGNTKGFAPSSLGCALDQEPESRCVCVLKERPSNHQNGGKTHLSCSLRHTESYQKCVSEWSLCTYGAEEVLWSLSEVEVPMLLHDLA